jgi:hypothetical protein
MTVNKNIHSDHVIMLVQFSHMGCFALLTNMTDWVTPDHLNILQEYKAAYDKASSESAQRSVLKEIAGKLRESGRKGLPKQLGKVWNAIPMLLMSHNLLRPSVDGIRLRMEWRMMVMMMVME